MSIFDEFESANAGYAAGFAKGHLPMPPGRKVAVVACMDARLDPAKALGLEEGDAHVIRNAGGLVTDDAIRSLVISQQLLATEAIAVVHHTDCGMLTFSNDVIRGLIAERLGADASHIDFRPFGDLEESVRRDVAAIRANPLIRDEIPVRGYVYEVETGRIREVARA